jgi:uncharacterized protein YbcI
MHEERQAAPPDVEERNPLTQRDWTDGVEIADDRRRSINLEISNAMVGLKKQFYGKGPVKSKTYINDNYVFCILEGGLTKNEETLLQAGEEQLVRQYRLRFQEVMAQTTKKAVEEITRRKVIGYHSQVIFDPEFGFELFVLDGPPER